MNEEKKNQIEELNENEFGGTFHERDSHAENDIVTEISDSFTRFKGWFKTSS